MSHLETADKLEQMINGILSNRESQILKLEETIDNDDAKIIELNNKFIDLASVATSEEYEKKFKALKKEIDNAAANREAHAARLEALRSLPLMTKEEAERLKEDAIKEYAEREKQTREKLLELAEKTKSIAAELRECKDHADEQLRRLKYNILGERQSYIRNPEVGRDDVIFWANAMTDHYYFKEYEKSMRLAENK